MAQKRAAPKSPTRGKGNAAAKKQKVAKEVTAKVPVESREQVAKEPDAFEEACRPILEVISEDPTLTESARTMLSAAVPLALKPSRAERHKFQESMVSAIARILHTIVSGREEGMKAAEGQIAKAASEQERAREILETGAGKEAESRQKQRESEAALHGAIEEVAAAKKAFNHFQELEVEHEKTIALKAQREAFVTGTWAQLKECAIKGRQWRERSKLIDSVVRTLEERHIENSCAVALPVALKEKPEQRGPIATRCIEHVDDQLQRYVQEAQDQIDQYDAAAEERAKALKDAEAKLAGAEVSRETAQNDLVAAENDLLEAVEAHKAMASTLKQLTGQMDALGETLSGAKGFHMAAKDVAMRFETFVECGAPAAARQIAEEKLEAGTSVEVGTLAAPTPIVEGNEQKTMEEKAKAEPSTTTGIEVISC